MRCDGIQRGGEHPTANANPEIETLANRSAKAREFRALVKSCGPERSVRELATCFPAARFQRKCSENAFAFYL